jgi:hypothetical protein
VIFDKIGLIFRCHTDFLILRADSCQTSEAAPDHAMYEDRAEAAWAPMVWAAGARARGGCWACRRKRNKPAASPRTGRRGWMRKRERGMWCVPGAGVPAALRF